MTSRTFSNPWFDMRNESTRNWLALGLLLAAWNFSDNDAVRSTASRPEPLQKHSFVTVRSARMHVMK